jgi:hypothetical protein
MDGRGVMTMTMDVTLKQPLGLGIRSHDGEQLDLPELSNDEHNNMSLSIITITFPSAKVAV